MDGACDDIECGESEAPETLCMARSTNGIHSFVEGEYSQTGVVGAIGGTVEYARSEAVWQEDEEVELYVWWYGEIEEDAYTPWWVLSGTSLNDAIAANGSILLYGFCEAEVVNPTDCAAGWRFYLGGYFAHDDTFHLEDGECAVTST